MKIAHLFCLLILIFDSTSFSQKGKYRFEHITTENGLSQAQVNCILQDRKGFLWIATINGLNRYDGYNFKVYKYESANPNSISHNEIKTIYEDKEGILWIGTSGGGLNKFERESERFLRYKTDNNNKNSISSNKIRDIYEDSEGILWIGTEVGGLNQFNKKTNQFTHYIYDSTDSRTISNNNVFSICEDRRGDFWIGTFGGGLNKFDKKTESFIHYKHDPDNPKSISSNKIYKIYEDREGLIWIGTYLSGLNKLVSFSEKDGSPEFDHFISYNFLAPNSLGNNMVYSMLEDNDGLLWIATQWGLNISDKKNIIKLFRDNPLDPENINFSTIFSLYEDRSGIIWIGTTGGGLNKLNKNKLSFTSYNHSPFYSKGFNGAPTNCFYEESDSIIWIGTGGGINVMQRKTEEFTSYKYDPDQPRGLISNVIYKIFQDSQGIIWVGTGHGLFKLLTKIDEKGGPIFKRIINDPTNPLSLSDNSINSICEDRSGVLWIGTNDGISKLVPDERSKSNPKFIIYKNDANSESSLSDNYVNQIFEDKFGNIWVATERGGLNRYIKETASFIRYEHDPKNSASLGSNLVLCIYEDNSGHIWLGTGDGFDRFNRVTKEFKRYSEKDGLTGDYIYGILEDDSGRLWLSTNKGITRFDPGKESFKNFDTHDGLQEGGYFRGAYLKTKHGEFLFGGLNGFNLFHPDSIKENSHIPQIAITDFQLNNISVPIGFDSSTNRVVLQHSISETGELELNYEDKGISFGFAALDFYNPEKNQYAYKLEGFDEQWNYTDAGMRLATYTNLNPGEYVFRVKGSNNDGYWNEKGASLKIIILPPWWATTWAYILYMVLILSMIYFAWKLQLRRVRNKHEIEMTKFEAEKMREMDEMKSRFFTNISHEFRTPLTLIFGPVKDVIEETNEPKTRKNVRIIKRNATRLYSLVNQLLDLSKLESGKMKLETSEQNIIPLLKGIFLSFASFAERKKIALQFNSTEENLKLYIDEAKLEKIVNNLLSNAFKFTPEGGRIDLIVKKLPNAVELRITDNGIGISKDRINKIFNRFYQVDSSHTRAGEGTGIGLALTKELVELHKGTIQVESVEGEGTTFRVKIPLGKDHLRPEEIVEKEIQVDSEAFSEQSDLLPAIENQKANTDLDAFLGTEKSLLLIVEDNSDVRNYIINHLEKDYRLQEAVDGEDGLNQAIKHIPDLIISDVMMPKMDGFKLCDKLKTDEKTSHIPIIMLTAKAASEDKIEGYETGADDYIMKPFNANELKARIKNLIETRKKLQDKFSRDEYPPEIYNKKLGRLDEEFMKNVLEVIQKHISDEEFTIEEFESEFAMSRAQIHRKLKALTGKSPSRYIRSIRLIKAKKMIKEDRANISEIAYSVGFSSPTYFSKCFKEEFGYSPSELGI